MSNLRNSFKKDINNRKSSFDKEMKNEIYNFDRIPKCKKSYHNLNCEEIMKSEMSIMRDELSFAIDIHYHQFLDADK